MNELMKGTTLLIVMHKEEGGKKGKKIGLLFELHDRVTKSLAIYFVLAHITVCENSCRGLYNTTAFSHKN